MHKVDGAEMLGILIRKLGENWEKLCDEYLDEDELRPTFKVLPTSRYIMWVTTNFADNIKSITGDKNEMPTGSAINAACGQIDDTVLGGYPIIDDVIIKLSC